MGNWSKTDLFLVCETLFQDRIAETTVAMKAAQESANSNEKSSMGDKYETGRAMSQLERDMHAKQLAKLQDEYSKLQKVSLQGNSKSVETGALVQTETQLYWIAVALGQVAINTQKVMVVSPLSPIAQLMLGLKVGATFTLNGKTQKILEIS
jgi:transcription elongation GreA/GreB family factor